MKILIQRFTLRHDGEEYLPGDMLEVDDTIGARLLKNARGAIVEIKEVTQRKKNKPVIPKPEAPPPNGKPEKADGAAESPDEEEVDQEPNRELGSQSGSAAEDGDPEPEGDDGSLELPSADPTTAVKPKRGGGKK